MLYRTPVLFVAAALTGASPPQLSDHETSSTLVLPAATAASGRDLQLPEAAVAVSQADHDAGEKESTPATQAPSSFSEDSTPSSEEFTPASSPREDSTPTWSPRTRTTVSSSDHTTPVSSSSSELHDTRASQEIRAVQVAATSCVRPQGGARRSRSVGSWSPGMMSRLAAGSSSSSMSTPRRPRPLLGLKSQRVSSGGAPAQDSVKTSLSDAFTHTAAAVPRCLAMAGVDRLSQCSRFFRETTLPEKHRRKDTLEKNLTAATETLADVARAFTNWTQILQRRSVRPELNGSPQQLAAEQDAEQKVRTILTVFLAVRGGLMDVAEQAAAAGNAKVFLNILGRFRESIFVVLEHAPVSVEEHWWSLPMIARGHHLPLAVVTNALTELGLIWYHVHGVARESSNPVVVEMLRVLKKPLERLGTAGARGDHGGTGGSAREQGAGSTGGAAREQGAGSAFREHGGIDAGTRTTPRFGIVPAPGNGDDEEDHQPHVVINDEDLPPAEVEQDMVHQDENETVVEGYVCTLVLSHIATPATAPPSAWDAAHRRRVLVVPHAGSAVLQASADLLTQIMDDLSTRMVMFASSNDLEDPLERFGTMRFRLYVSGFLQFAQNILVTIGNLLPPVVDAGLARAAAGDGGDAAARGGLGGLSPGAETAVVRLYTGIVRGSWSAAMEPAALAEPADAAALEAEAVRGAVLGLALVARSSANMKLTVGVLTERLVLGVERTVAQVARAEQWLRARGWAGRRQWAAYGTTTAEAEAAAEADSAAEADFIAEATFIFQRHLSSGELLLIVETLNGTWSNFVYDRVRDFSTQTLILEAVSSILLCATIGPWKLESVGLISVFFSSTVVLEALALLDAVLQDVRVNMVIKAHGWRMDELDSSSATGPAPTPANPNELDGVAERRLHDTAHVLQTILQDLPPGETTPRMRTVAAASLATLGQVLTAHAVQRPLYEKGRWAAWAVSTGPTTFVLGTNGYDVDGSVCLDALGPCGSVSYHGTVDILRVREEPVFVHSL